MDERKNNMIACCYLVMIASVFLGVFMGSKMAVIPFLCSFACTILVRNNEKVEGVD